MKTKNEHRALKNLVHRKREGEYEAMIADPRPKSWSAGHPAYEGTSISGSSLSKGGGGSIGHGDSHPMSVNERRYKIS